jgi:Fe-S cluster assembly protein SufD
VAAIEDKWIAGSVERCSGGAGVDALRDAALARLAHARMPTSRVEEYRFTDLAPLVTASPVAADPAARDAVDDASAWTLSSADATRVVLVDGVFAPALSDLTGVPEAAVVDALSADPALADAAALGAVSDLRGGVIADLNAALASDVVIIDLPAGLELANPVHVVQLSTAEKGGDGMRASAPRVRVSLGEGAKMTLVEEFAAAPGVAKDAAYWHNGVCEITLASEASLTHAMVQSQTRAAVHTRGTFLTQAESSAYALAEVNVGGKIGRHDLGVTQLGPRTSTELACFNLAGAGQCLDLHSSVTLDHEEGTTDQTHKCIVSAATGRGVFDGNVQVNKKAQRTDAGQISRNLLLVPKATVNVKPNLQIVADDVVCTHGCTVSDLEEEELFYIQSRGLSPAVARSLLVAGFGLEIVSKMTGEDLRKRVGELVREALDEDNVELAAGL